MAKNLVIVESPAKAKTIGKFLGSDYTVMSSFGHIRDLPKKGLNIDLEDNFKPKYEVSTDKKQVVRDLKKAAKDSEVWLASDEDREGEAIAWHLAQALGLDSEKTKRIVFHEITKSAIEQAIKTPRLIDQKLVDAQQARRILDRLVGYELSPVLWRKIRTGLSAGRVQSVAVRLIVERELEIRAFTPTTSFKVSAIFNAKNQEFKAELDNRPSDYSDVKTWFNGLGNSVYTVLNVTQKPSLRNPSAPFTTSTLQQEAARRLGYSVRQTMNLAQRLYENGHITYMRTDSTILSELALKSSAAYIISKFGKEYYKHRQYQTKNSSAQEAHEAIRPTDFNTLGTNIDEQQNKLYELIWQRTLASQMEQAKLEKTEVEIGISNKPEKFIAKGEVVKFDGFTRIYGNHIDDSLLPDVSKGQTLDLVKMTALETFSRPPARYGEAALVRKLEDLGIGRPSTFAPTISVIQTRGYVEKTDLPGTPKEIRLIELQNNEVKELTDSINQGADKSKLVPTPIAEITSDFLVKYFPSIVDYDFTAKVEANFDDIAEGKEKWQEMIGDFYKDFHPLVEKSADISRQEVSKARLIGNDPKSSEPIYARFGRFGPMLQKGEVEDDKDKKPVFAPMPADTTIDNVTLDQALTMFTLPKLVGNTPDGKEIRANIGRFGPYIQIDKMFVSIKPLDPHTITEEEALEKYNEQLAKNAAKNINEFSGGIKVLNGPYGPYVTDGKKNVRLAKTVDPKKLTEKEVIELIANAPAKKKSFTRRKKKS
jgi:DNA topoisomerase-1